MIQTQAPADKYYVMSIERRNSIIELCAQAAEWYSNIEKFTAEDVAARIRALKDKP